MKCEHKRVFPIRVSAGHFITHYGWCFDCGSLNRGGKWRLPLRLRRKPRKRTRYAREKFEIGQRVRMTPLGYQKLTPGRPTEGVVVGFSLAPLSVRVRPDGRKTVSQYWAGFWAPVK